MTDLVVNGPCSLLARTMDLLAGADDQRLVNISDATGLNYYWLRKIRDGEIIDPSVNKVQRLYEELNAKRLEV